MICRKCLFGPIHHPRCPSDEIRVQPEEALNEAEASQIEYLTPTLIENTSQQYYESEEEDEDE